MCIILQNFWFALMLIAVATVSSDAASNDKLKDAETQIMNYRTDSRVRRQDDSTDVDGTVDDSTDTPIQDASAKSNSEVYYSIFC